MDKFFVLALMPNLTFKRVWVNNDAVVTLLTEKKIVRAFKQITNQEAILSGAKLLWQDVLVDEEKI